MSPKNQRKLTATMPKLQQVITRLTEIMEDEHEVIEHHSADLTPEEIGTMQDGVNVLDENIWLLGDTLKAINANFQFE